MELLEKYFSDFTATQQQQFAALEALYAEWNTKINVISRKDIESLYLKHILHSLSITAVFDFAPGTEIIDLGTGGGFPGVPLAIFFPEVKFTLVDSIGKKLKVIDGIAESIGLTNIKTIHSRMEDCKDLQADYVVSRAVAPLGDLWKWSKPFIRKKAPDMRANKQAHGLICLKGGDLNEEISASNTRPYVYPISEFFPETEFENKYIIYVPK